MQMTDWNPAGSGGRQEPPTRRSHTKLWIGLGGGLALVVVIVVVAAVVLLKGPNVPAGTPNQYQLREILPSSEALPSGWRVTYRPQPLGTYITAGSLPPRPINACLDFGTGFDLGVAGDTFVSLASETARNGSGFLRIDALGVLPGDAAKAISAVKSWAGQCSAYADGPVSYTVAAAPVPGLGNESLNVITTQQTGTAGLNVFDNDTLVVRVGNSLIAIECIAPPSLLPKSLASIAAPLVRKLPTASSLAYTVPKPVPSAKPKLAAPLTPDLSAAQLQALLPFHSGLPRAYYQTTPQGASYTDPPPYSRPARETCSKLPLLEGESFITQDANFKVSAYVSATDLNSDNLDIVLGEPATAALANADYTALAKLAAACPTFSARQETYKTKVTSVAGLGEENIYIKMKPVAGNGLGAQYILLARVGDDGLVMVDCDMSAGDAPPSLVPIARAMVAKL
jgi:hypothetical protein